MLKDVNEPIYQILCWNIKFLPFFINVIQVTLYIKAKLYLQILNLTMV